MQQKPDVYVLETERRPVQWGLGFARLSFACGALAVGLLLLGALVTFGGTDSRGYFYAAIVVGFAWWALHRAIAWIARGFSRH